MNFAENDRRIERGDITEAEARRHGRTHRAYGWTCKPPPNWPENLRAEYVAGWNEPPK